MGDQENAILTKYPIAAKRLAQYLIERQDFDAFYYVYTTYNIDFKPLSLKLGWGELNDKQLEFMKKLYRFNVYIPRITNLISYTITKKFNLVEFYIMQGAWLDIEKDTKRDALVNNIRMNKGQFGLDDSDVDDISNFLSKFAVPLESPGVP